MISHWDMADHISDIDTNLKKLINPIYIDFLVTKILSIEKKNI